MKFRTTVIALSCAVLACAPAHAADAGMQKLFDEMGAFGNVSGPGAYTAQGSHIITGGNLFMRVPQRNYKIAQMQLPSLKFGCGGIDLHAGSFSFISKEQLVAMMKNIGTTAVSYAFMLALDSISPQINKTLSQLQGIAQAMNSTNINSCEAGQAIAKGLTGDWQSTQQYWAQVSGPMSGLFSDQSDARENTQGNDGKAQQALNSINDPVAKRQAQPGNIAWRALSAMAELDIKDKQMLMSLSGTVILPKDINLAPDYRGPKNITFEQFVRGDDSGKLEIYFCKDGLGPDECLDMGDDLITVKPFAHQVQERLLAIADKFRNNQKLTAAEIGFINVSTVPVYKALSVHSAHKDAKFEAHWIGRHADLIAAEYAYFFILQVTKQMQVAYTQTMQGSNSTATEQFTEMLANLNTLKQQAQGVLSGAYAKVGAMERVAAEINQAERALMLGLPSNLAGNIRFASTTR